MLKVIELDGQGKDADGYVFTLTIGNERFGITDQEVAEIIKAKHSGKGATKRPPARKAQTSEQNTLEPATAEAAERAGAETAEGAV